MPVLSWHCGSFENRNTLVFSSSQSLIGIFRSLHHKPARAVGVNVVSQVGVYSLCFRLRVSSPLTLRIELGRGQFFLGQVSTCTCLHRVQHLFCAFFGCGPVKLWRNMLLFSSEVP